MATITPVSRSSAGVAVTFAAASGGGDSVTVGTAGVPCDLVVRNGGSTITLTLTGIVACSQGSLHDKVISCLAGDTEITIPAQCINPTTGVCLVTYSGVVTVTVAAVH